MLENHVDYLELGDVLGPDGDPKMEGEVGRLASCQPNPCLELDDEEKQDVVQEESTKKA